MTVQTSDGRDVPIAKKAHRAFDLRALAQAEVVEMGEPAERQEPGDAGGTGGALALDADDLDAAVEAYRTGDMDRLQAIRERLDTGATNSTKTADALQSPRAEAGAASKLTLSDASLDRATEWRAAFAKGQDNANLGARLLEDFAALETAAGLSLLDAEAAAVAMLHRTINNPTLALKVLAMAKEIEALSSALRRRTQGALAAAAGLRAQSKLLALQGRQDGK
jgi:hypothetical protein